MCSTALFLFDTGKHYVPGVFDFKFQRKWVEKQPESENADVSVSSVSAT